MGIGHFYVGRITRGIVILIVGMVTGIVWYLLFFIGVLAAFVGQAGLFGLSILVGLGRLALWVWQIHDAYSLAKRFNESVGRTGKPPW
jgi:TM2 domain-containing membrane protein YozV